MKMIPSWRPQTFFLAAALMACTCADAALAQQPPALPNFTISIGSVTAQYADLFIALEEGLFKKAGVNVQITLSGSQYATTVIAGRADLAVSGAVGTLTLAHQGKLMKVVYATGSGSADGFVVNTNSSLQKAMDLSGKKLAVFQLGQNRGEGQALSNWIVGHGGEPLDLGP